MVHPAAKKRGADPHVPEKPRDKSGDAGERKLEQGLEETMAGSDPVSVTQPKPDKSGTMSPRSERGLRGSRGKE
jgi:hypothetical protein